MASASNIFFTSYLSNDHSRCNFPATRTAIVSKMCRASPPNQHSPLSKDRVELASRLQSCKNVRNGRQIHQEIIVKGFEQDVFIQNLLINMYGKCGAVKDALQVFSNMVKKNLYTWNIMIDVYVQAGHLKEALGLFKQMPKHDIVSWNAMIAGYCKQGCLEEAINFFYLMPARDNVTWNTMLSGCIQQGNLRKALEFFKQMPERDVISWTALVAAYATMGQLSDACLLFEKMPKKNVVSWNAMIMGYMENGCIKEAWRLFESMHCQDVVSWNTMIDGYAKWGQLDHALRLFNQMPQQNVVSWNVMIAAHAQHGRSKDALQMLKEMQTNGFVPNGLTFSSILFACSHSGLVDVGCHWFALVANYNCNAPSMKHYGCMVDLLGRIGWFPEANSLINNMAIAPDATSWRTLLGSCKIVSNVEWGKHAAGHAFDLDPENAAAYISLANLYAVN